MHRNKKNRAYVVITFMKFLEGVLGLYSSYCIISLIKFRGPLLVIYITWPTYVLMSFAIGIGRIIFHKKKFLVSVYEIAVCLTGFIMHMVCTILLMYYLPRVDYVEPGEEGKTTRKELHRFARAIKPAVTSTVIAAILLFEGFLGIDILLTRDGVPLWKEPEYPNPQVDLIPNMPIHMVYPWNTRLRTESVASKLLKIKRAKDN